MISVQVTSQVQIDLEQLLDGVAQLETDDLEKLAEQINILLAQRKVASLPQVEAQLLQQINQGLPEAVQHRYNELRGKLRSETIAPQEHEELLALVDTVEQSDAERLQNLIRLAQLRQVPLPDLKQQLGIHSPTLNA